MANIIGSLLVELGINSAAWTAGLSKAQAQAQAFGRQVTGSFAGMGKSVQGFMGQMSAMGGVIGASMSQVGGAIGSVTSVALGMAGAFGAVLGPIALGVGALLAIGAAAVSSTAGLANLAEQIANTAAVTGLSSTEVQIFNQLAEESGVSSQGLTMVLGRLNAQLGQFQISGKAGQFVRALQSVGVEVKTAQGNLRPMTAILADFYKAWAAIEDPTKRAAFGMAAVTMRGRPLIQTFEQARLSGEGLESVMEGIAKSDVMISPMQMQRLAELDAAFDALGRKASGVWMRIKLSIAQALEAPETLFLEHDVAEFYMREKEKPTPEILRAQKQITGISPEEAAKLKQFAGEKEARRKKFEDDEKLMLEEAQVAMAGGKTKRALQEAEKQYQKEIEEGAGKEALATSKKIQSLKERVKAEEAATRVGKVSLDSVLKFINGLEAETASQMRLAAAVGKTSAEIVMLTAAEKGHESVAKLMADLNAQIATKETERANAVKAGNAQRIKEMDDILDALRKQTVELAKNEEHVIALEQLKAASGLSRVFENSLISETEKLKAEAAALKVLAAAAGKTGTEIEAANIQKSMEGTNQQLEKAGELLARMTAKFGAVHPDVISLAAAFDRLRAGVFAVGEGMKNVKLETLNEQLSKQEAATKLDVLAIEMQTRALFQNAEAQREAAIQAQIRAFIVAQPSAGAAEIARETAMLRARSDAQQKLAVAELARNLNARLAYEDKIAKLKDVIAMEKVSRETQLAAMSAAKEATRALTEELSNQAIQSGTTREALHGLFAQIALDGENLRVKVFAAIRTMIEGLSTELAKFVVTGKANFKSLFASLGENILKSTFQKGLGSIAGFLDEKLGLGGLLGGAVGGKPDGTKGNPMHVLIDDALGSMLPGFSEGGGGGGGILGGIFNVIGSLFGGFGLGGITTGQGAGAATGNISSGYQLAAGGDVTPGRRYIVGEDGPEVLSPRRQGTVTPMSKLGGGKPVNMTFQFYGVQDADSFKKNKAQIAADFYAAASLAYARAR